MHWPERNIRYRAGEKAKREAFGRAILERNARCSGPGLLAFVLSVWADILDDNLCGETHPVFQTSWGLYQNKLWSGGTYLYWRLISENCSWVDNSLNQQGCFDPLISIFLKVTALSNSLWIKAWVLSPLNIPLCFAKFGISMQSFRATFFYIWPLFVVKSTQCSSRHPFFFFILFIGPLPSAFPC